MQTPLVLDGMKSCLHGVLKKHPVHLAYLYGSQATGLARAFSDIDIAVVVDEAKVSPAGCLRLELVIEDEIAAVCELSQADVRIINYAPLAIRGAVMTEGKLVYSDDEIFRVDFETSTRMEYFDFQPVLKQMRMGLFDNIRKGR